MAYYLANPKYKCYKCGRDKCKLWGEYMEFDMNNLLCFKCLTEYAKSQHRIIESIEPNGRLHVCYGAKGSAPGRKYVAFDVAWKVPAVFNENFTQCWTVPTSIPDRLVAPWQGLPN